ncbi:MAG: ATP-binding protein [Prevotella sp.]|nr:ATP-binding protein [Prevotella sp.]
MVYYELYGLPGAGKSTLANIIIYELRAKGYKVGAWDDVYYRCPNVIFKQSLKREMLFHINKYKLFFWCWKAYKNCKNPNRAFYNKLLILTHQLLMVAEENNYDIVILEEGAIQYISSLRYLEDFSDDKDYKRISRYLNKRLIIYPVFCNIDIAECMSRVRNRGYGSKRFSYSVGCEKFKQTMIYKEKNLRRISSTFLPPIEINMKAPVADNARLLVAEILSRSLDERNKT